MSKNIILVNEKSIEWSGFFIHKGFISGIYEGVKYVFNGKSYFKNGIEGINVYMYAFLNNKWEVENVSCIKNAKLFEFLKKGISKKERKAIENEYMSSMELEGIKRNKRENVYCFDVENNKNVLQDSETEIAKDDFYGKSGICLKKDAKVRNKNIKKENMYKYIIK